MIQLKTFALILNRLFENQLVKRFLFVILLLFTGLLLSFILYSNWHVLINFDWQINLWALHLTFVFYTLNLVVIIYGWRLIVGGIANHWNFFEHFRIYVLTDLAKRVPGSLWHIAGRLILYHQMGIRKSLVTLCSAIEAVLLINSAIITYLLANVWSNSDNYFGWWGLIILLLGMASIHPKFITWVLTRLKRVNDLQPLKYKNLLRWLLVYVFGWNLGGVTVFFLINAVTPLPLSQLPDVITAWALAGSLSSLIFFSPSGLGVQEVTLTLSLSNIIPEPIAIIVAILLRILLVLYQLIWAGLVMALSKCVFPARISLIPPKDY